MNQAVVWRSMLGVAVREPLLLLGGERALPVGLDRVGDLVEAGPDFLNGGRHPFGDGLGLARLLLLAPAGVDGGQGVRGLIRLVFLAPSEVESVAHAAFTSPAFAAMVRKNPAVSVRAVFL
ncbi:hypothetical protein R2F25_38060 [Streptomyces sp. UP1A-1]|nr:hypothetical protein [Streptomyces sp. UP1A-1]